jgi:hypothetical protein
MRPGRFQALCVHEIGAGGKSAIDTAVLNGVMTRLTTYILVWLFTDQ